MKNLLFILFLALSNLLFSQKKVVKKLQTTANEITIYTAGLDNLVLENSDSGFLEVYLYAEDYDDQLIKIANTNKEVKINFEFKGTQTREVVFRKFITKRLQRANAVVKIPKGKKVFIFGENVDIESKNHQNELAIYIENGIVKLNEIEANTILKLYSGNVYASVKNTNLELSSKDGKIKVDDILYHKNHQKKLIENIKEFKVSTLKANIFLTNQ